MMYVLLSSIFLVQAIVGAQAWPQAGPLSGGGERDAGPETCIALHCALEGAACVVNADCLAALMVQSVLSSHNHRLLYLQSVHGRL